MPEAIRPKNIPPELRNIDSWLVWKMTPNKDPTKKPLKVPYYVSGRKRAGAIGTKDDRKRLTSYHTALDTYRKGGGADGEYAGLGFAIFPEHEITILDLDDCIDESGDFSEFANEVLETGSYVERSPSGRGLRAVFTGGAVVPGKRNGHIENGERVEIYCGSAFVTITGHVVSLDNSIVLDLPKKIKRTLSPVIGGGVNSPSSSIAPVSDDEGAIMSPDAVALPEFTMDHARVVLNKLPATWGNPGHGTWYRVAAALHLQFDGGEEAYQLLDEWSQGLDGYDEAANRARWNAGFSHSGGRGGLTTMRNLVFESIQNGGLRVKRETMEKWRLSRPAEDDFEDVEKVDGPGLPEYTDLLGMMDIGHKIETPPPPVEWLVENFIARENVSILGGGSGTSKSYLTMQMCSLGAVGVEEFGGMRLKSGGFRTAYLAYEDADSVMHNRIWNLKRYLMQRLEGEGIESDEEEDAAELAEEVAAEGDDDEPEFDTVEEGAFIDKWRSNFLLATSEILDSGAWTLLKRREKYEEAKKTELHDYLVKFVTDQRIDLLVFDTASEAHEVEENSTTDMVFLMRLFRQLATSTGCAVLVVQHIQKGAIVQSLDDINQANIRGSSAFVDKSRNVMMLARMPLVDAEAYGMKDIHFAHDNIIAMKHVKANLGEYNKLTFFERSSTGVLLHKPDIKLPEFDNLEAEESIRKDEEKDERAKQRHALDSAKVFALIKSQNKLGEFPSATRVRTLAASQHGMPDTRIRVALGTLEAERQIARVEDLFGGNKDFGYEATD